MAHFNVKFRVEVNPPKGMKVDSKWYQQMILDKVEHALLLTSLQTGCLYVKRGNPPRPDVSARAKRSKINA